MATKRVTGKSLFALFEIIMNVKNAYSVGQIDQTDAGFTTTVYIKDEGETAAANIQVSYPDWLTVQEYAEKKKVSAPAVYKAIEAGRISVVLVGSKPYTYIPWQQNKDMQFDKSFQRR